MGGWGSGRRWTGKDATTDFRSWDIRKTEREGWLEPGRYFISKWYVREEVQSSIEGWSESDHIVVAYRHQYNGEPWESLKYPIALERTRCHFGGTRAWFLCPGHECGRRVAILYSGRLFLCRHCRQLSYNSQQESPLFRALSRVQDASIRLGGMGVAADGVPPRPKGMHIKTYQRLARQFRWLERDINLCGLARFGCSVL